MSKINFKEIKNVVERLFIEIQEELKKAYYQNDKEESKKENAETPTDILTKYDILISEKIKSTLKKNFPDIGIISEEDRLDEKKNLEKIASGKEYFLIDPIDGTRNFTKNIPIFFTGVSLVKNSKTLMTFTQNPITEEFFYAEIGKGSFKNGKKVEMFLENNPAKSSIQMRTLDPEDIEASFLLQAKIYTKLKEQNFFQIEDSFCSHNEISAIACGRNNGGIFKGSEI